MKIEIDGLPVIFPYEYIYPEQYAYMRDIKKSLDARGHCLLEMPSGTGKTVALLALIVAYQQAHPADDRKLVYCSRTVPEIEKALDELKRLMRYRGNEQFLALGLTSRRNLCVHPIVSLQKNGSVVDSMCRNLTAPSARNAPESEKHPDSGCEYFENLETQDSDAAIESGVYTLEDFKEYAKGKHYCPYFFARKLIPFANVIIYSYHYLLDPKIAEYVSKELSKDSIIVFDEAHNIDNVCIESLSIDISRPMLEAGTRGIKDLDERIRKLKETNSEKLQTEYSKLVEGLAAAQRSKEKSEFLSNPILPVDILNEAVPGNIRKAEHFVGFLRRFLEYLKTRMRVMHVVAESPTSFLQHLKEITFIERKPLRYKK